MSLQPIPQFKLYSLEHKRLFYSRYASYKEAEDAKKKQRYPKLFHITQIWEYEGREVNFKVDPSC